MNRRCHIIILLLYIVGSLHGQYRFDNYTHLSAEDGLPSSNAFDLAEDKYGFIWIATSGGLGRYDGSKVNRFYKSEKDSVDLPSQYVYSLLITGDSLWVGSRKGLSILNIETGAISNHLLGDSNFELDDDVHERNLLRDIIKDRQGNVWLAPAYGGFVKWDKHSQTFKSYPILPDENLPRSYGIGEQTGLNSLIQDVTHDSIFWGINSSGLIKLNSHTGVIKRVSYQGGDEKAEFIVNRKICIYQSEDGLIYTGSWGAGLSIYDPSSGEYYLLSEKFHEDFPAALVGNSLFEIVADGSGNLYLTYFDGLYKYNVKNHTFQLLNTRVFKGKDVWFGINFVDTKNRIWFSSPVGVIVADPIEQQFRWHSLADLNTTDITTIPRAIVEDFYPGYISLAGQYTDGIYHIDPSTGRSFKNVFDGELVVNNYFSSRGLSQINENTLLISSGQEIFTLKKGSNAFVPLTPQLPLQYSYLMNNLVDDFGTAWFGCRMDGLFAIDLNSKEIVSYGDQVPYNFVSRNFQDSKKNVWFQVERGHVVFNRKLNRLDVFHYSKDTSTVFKSTRNFCECPNGELWAAGLIGGIGLLSTENPENGLIDKIAIKNKEGKKVRVDRIACNQKNELWGIGSGGIQKINRSDWTCETFSLTYGANNWSGMFQFLKDDQLFIGSRDGFYTVDPNDLIINSEVPVSYVSKIMSSKGQKGSLEEHLREEPIYLKANENIITIEFSSINHSLAKKTQFKYMLTGVDEEWKDPGEKRSFTYSYLPGGEYVFKLKACNNEGVWNTVDYKLPIYVATPWYKTKLFWFSISCLLLGLGYAYYQQRIRQIRNESQLKSNFEKQKADLEMNALRAQMNPHFIFNCLNSIESYIIKNDNIKASSYLNNFSRLIRLILQNSRTNYVNLQDELEALELYIQLEQMRLRNSFTYQITLMDDFNAENYEVPPMLIQPFVENSIWHGLQPLGKDGKVIIEINKIGESLQCTIQDNGIGRKEAARNKEAKKVKRKSMGMNITFERMEVINNMYDIKNEVLIEDLYGRSGKPIGTRVILHIPI